VTDAVAVAVASALAGKVAEAALAGGRTACNALLKTVRERFGRDKVAVKALEAALRKPEDEFAVAELADTLKRVMAEDTAFAAQVRTLWLRASTELSVGDDGVSNSVSGIVRGNLIQARDMRVEGGIHFGDASPPERPKP
jgi:hypothetical protein